MNTNRQECQRLVNNGHFESVADCLDAKYGVKTGGKGHKRRTHKRKTHKRKMHKRRHTRRHRR